MRSRCTPGFAIPVAGGGTAPESQVWVLGRTLLGFSGRDREVAAAIAPVLTAVARHRSVLLRLDVDAATGDVLTQREIAVLELLAEGFSASAVAGRLGVSTRTVQKHAEHIYSKLGVHSRQEAVTACAALGIVRAR